MRLFKIALFCTSLFAATGWASTTQPVTFPTVDLAGEGSPLAVQLAIPVDEVGYREPVPVYVRFVNSSETPYEIPLTEMTPDTIETKLLWSVENQQPDMPSFAWRAGLESPSILLQPGEALTFRLHDRLFPVGRHRISFSYQSPRPDSTKMVSNVVELTVHDRPLDEEMQEILAREYAIYRRFLDPEIFREREDLATIISTRFLIGSPFSVQVLQDYLKSNYPGLRAVSAELLGRIADPGMAKEFGIQRDVSAAGLIVDLLGTEKDENVLRNLVIAVRHFYDALDESQREQLRRELVDFLEHGNAQVRKWSAWTLIRLFPDEFSRVRSKLQDDDFLPESSRNQLLNRLEEAESANSNASE